MLKLNVLRNRFAGIFGMYAGEDVKVIMSYSYTICNIRDITTLEFLRKALLCLSNKTARAFKALHQKRS